MADSRLRIAATSQLHCAVCGAEQIVFDSVLDGTLLHVALCCRCEHRWTWRDGETSRAPLAAARPKTRKVEPGHPARWVPSAA